MVRNKYETGALQVIYNQKQKKKDAEKARPKRQGPATGRTYHTWATALAWFQWVGQFIAQ